MSDRDVHWTAKGPALIAGLVLLCLGVVSTARGRAVLGIVVIVLGVAFVAYSMTIKEWCALHQTGWGVGAWNTLGFGGSLGECIKEKSWFSF